MVQVFPVTTVFNGAVSGWFPAGKNTGYPNSPNGLFYCLGCSPLRVQEEGGERVRPGQGERETGRDGSEKAKALSAGGTYPEQLANAVLQAS